MQTGGAAIFEQYFVDWAGIRQCQIPRLARVTIFVQALGANACGFAGQEVILGNALVSQLIGANAPTIAGHSNRKNSEQSRVARTGFGQGQQVLLEKIRRPLRAQHFQYSLGVA